MTVTAEMFDAGNPPPDYEGSSEVDWDSGKGAPARLVFHTGNARPIGSTYTIGYYRGPIYTTYGSWRSIPDGDRWSTNVVSIFTTGDRREIVVAVDHGPIYISTNSGIAWTVVAAPGEHQFPISTAADGSGFFAHVNVEPSDLPADLVETNRVEAGWYAVASSSDGSKLIVSGSQSQAAPALNVRYYAGRIVIAWPAEFSSFALEHNSSLEHDKWNRITNGVVVMDGENRVTVAPSLGSDFFRLKSE